ncbi:cache domain-containing protein [bacterium]|nr:cache domain-containing protein [candidate division CSSED10-310 bacterium]
MRLKSKFNLGILAVFGVLAVVIAVVTVYFVNSTVVGYATNHVRLSINSAWLIYNHRLDVSRRLLEFVASELELYNWDREQLDERLRLLRRRFGVDMLMLLDDTGRVVYRVHRPESAGDLLASDALVAGVLAGRGSISGTVLLERPRLALEGERFVRLCRDFGGEEEGMFLGAAVPIIRADRIVGVLLAGSLLNGATQKVDSIRDLVFANELYGGKPLGTATIFMRDLRISTNVTDNEGRHAIGTRVSAEVAERVLEHGESWTGRAWVVNAWYLSQYDPIRDPTGEIIGMLYVGELEQRYNDMRTRAVILFLAAIVMGLVIASFVFRTIRRNILSPIRKLSTATAEIAQGDLTQRVRLETTDEVGDLSRSFNRMVERLEQSNLVVQRKQAELEEANEELRMLNRNYMELLGFVSHELKNPLASAIMSVYMVKDGYLGDLKEPQKKALESVSQSLDYFQEMIKNYLDLSRVEKGEVEVRPMVVSVVPDAVMPVLEGLEGEIQEQGMVVENHLPVSMILVADRDLLRIIYDNLISNAVKYGRPGGRIVLDGEERGADSVLSVYNEGYGIPAAKMSLLFKKFSRLNEPGYKGKKGTGLGLFICREIVEKHGGTIWAESEEGAWVRFSFSIPRNKELR